MRPLYSSLGKGRTAKVHETSLPMSSLTNGCLSLPMTFKMTGRIPLSPGIMGVLAGLLGGAVMIIVVVVRVHSR